MTGKHRLFALSALFALATATAASAQDFQKSYRLAAGGQVRITNISGDVSVTGYDGDAILVKAHKTGRDIEKVEVEDRGRRKRRCRRALSERVPVRRERSIRSAGPALLRSKFERISSVSGNVKVSDVTGRIKASAVSGNVTVRSAAGSVSATSVSGNVDVDIGRLDGDDDMKFTSVSGDVHVKAPAQLAADIDMSSFSGSIKTDFAIEVQEGRHGRAHGRAADRRRRHAAAEDPNDVGQSQPST